MTTIDQLHIVASALLSKKLHESLELKHEIENNLETINHQTNDQIHNLWKDLRKIHNAHQKEEAKTNHNKPTTTTSKKSPSTGHKRRGRKRKHVNNSPSSITNNSESFTKEPPTKRRRTSSTKSVASNTSTNNNKKFTFAGRSSESSISSSAPHRSHRRLTMRTTPTSTDNNKDITEHVQDNDDEHYLHKMLKNAEKALELTENNMDILQKCINSVEFIFEVFLF